MTPESHSPEPVESREVEAPLVLDALPAQLGFIETPALTQLREGAIEAVRQNPDAVLELLTRYHTLANEFVEEEYAGPSVDQTEIRKIDRVAKASIGVMVAMALNYRDTGQLDRYYDELEDAWVYADQQDLVAVVETLGKAISS